MPSVDEFRPTESHAEYVVRHLQQLIAQHGPTFPNRAIDLDGLQQYLNVVNPPLVSRPIPSTMVRPTIPTPSPPTTTFDPDVAGPSR